VSIALAAGMAAVVAAQQPPPAPPAVPRFQTGIDLIVTEATVVDRDGRLVPGLGPEDFTAEVGGKPRRVVSAELVDYANVKPGETQPELDISTNQEELTGRRIVIVVDQISLRPESRPVIEAAKRWVASLGAADRVGLVVLPPPGTDIDPTTDHQRVIDAMARLAPIGSLPPPFSQYNVSIWEAFRIKEVDTPVRDDVVQRECRGDPRCPDEIDAYAQALVLDAQSHVQPVLRSFRALMQNLGAIPGPKHVVLLSSGWPISEREAGAEIAVTAADAAKSNVIVHTFTAERWALAATRSRAPSITNGVPDKTVLMSSVEIISGSTGGQAIRLTNDGERALAALRTGMAGYYRVGIQGDAADFDGKPRRISLKVSKPGATLSAYRRLVAGAAPAITANEPSAVLNEALRSPRLLTGLSLRATSYVLQSDDAGSRDIRIALVAEVARGAAGPARAVAALYGLDGKPVTAVEASADLSAAGGDTVTMALKAPAAPYILRLAVLDADGRIGSLQRAVDARWKRTGEIETPGFVVFRSTGPGATPEPLLRSISTAEQLVAQVPFVSTGAAPPLVTFEVKAEGSASAFLKRTARIGRTSAGSAVAEEMIPASILPPGRYVVSATIRPGAARPFVRGFVVEAAPGVPVAVPSRTTSSPVAPPGGTAAAPLALARPARFSTAAVLAPDFVGPLIDQMAARPDAAAVRDALASAKTGPWPADQTKGPLSASPLAAQFVAGLARLQKGDLDQAADAFRAALKIAPDFGPALTYLGACYAAGQRDREAAGAWQTALLRDRTSPLLQRLAIEAWLRADKPAAAAALVTQARARWPDDPAFVRLAAQAAIADGRVQEGVDLVASMPQPDAPALLAALAALYDGAQRGVPVFDPQRDLDTMQRLRERYAAADGDALGLVDSWIADAAKRSPHGPEK
jgi:VWFA-related protein